MQDEPIKDWLNKKNHETTIADTLIIHATCITITIVITLSVSGWMSLAKSKNNGLA